MEEKLYVGMYSGGSGNDSTNFDTRSFLFRLFGLPTMHILLVYSYTSWFRWDGGIASVVVLSLSFWVYRLHVSYGKETSIVFSVVFDFRFRVKEFSVQMRMIIMRIKSGDGGIFGAVTGGSGGEDIV